MVKNKKSQGLSFNVIIIAVISLIVLVVIIAIFTGVSGDSAKSLQSCWLKGGHCDDKCEPGETEIPDTKECVKGNDKGEHCCVGVFSSSDSTTKTDKKKNK